MRGTVSGAFWGLILGTGGLAVASLVNEQSGPADMPQITAPQATAADPVTGPLAQDTSDAPPETAMDTPQMTPPEPAADSAVIDSAPATPPVVINDDPPQQPPAADIPESDGVAMIARDDRARTDEAVARPQLADDAIIAPEPPVMDVAPAPAPQQPAETTAPVIMPSVQEDDSPVVTPSVNDAPGPVVVAQDPAGVQDDAALPAPSDSRTGATRVEQTAPAPATALPQVNNGVRINRPGSETPAADGTPSETAEPADAAQDAPALLRYAAVFETPDDLPLLGVVLLDDGTMPDAAVRLADLPFPATIILDPRQPEVGRKMTAYRDAGAEVGLQITLPLGARAQDVEVAFEAAFAMVPESVVLFSGGADLLQGDRAVTDQVLAVLAAEGLGLVVVERGLNNVARQADAAGVPAASVLRDLGGSDSTAASRALDQAAFRARQGQGEVVVVTGPLTPAFLAQLSDWVRANGAGQVALAPASAILSPR